MIKHKWIGAIAALLMAAAVLATCFAYLNPSIFASVAKTPEPKYVSAMDKTEIMSVQIVADEAEWADMLQNATAEEYIPATVIINGTKIENVGIRPKGNSSLSMVAQDDTTNRFSFKIEFDHYITGQTWLGLDKLVVNNMQGDATYMKEYLSYDIMDYAGVESPLYAFADITVNGEAWGFYLAVEALDDSFAEHVYGKDHGKLYKPESMGMRGEGRMNEFIENMQGGGAEQATVGELPQDAQEFRRMEEWQVPTQSQTDAPDGQNPRMPGGNPGGFGGGMASNGVSLAYTDDELSNYSAIFDNAVFDTNESDNRRVVNALKKLSNGEDLQSVVDVEAVLKYFAAHTVVVNLDSYVSGMGHNYYLCEKDGRLTILPWDYNLAFGGFQAGDASSVINFPIDTPVSGVSLEERPLLGKLLEVPEYLELYHGYLRQIVDGYFNSGKFAQTVDSLNALIASRVENDPTAFYDYGAYQEGIQELKKLGLLRAQSIEGQLDGTIPSTSEGQRTNSSQLIDASSVNLAALGSQGGGGFGGGPGGVMVNMPGGEDMGVMRQTMEILSASGDNGLSDEQLAQLHDLGLTDERIAEMRDMTQRGLGGQRPGGMSNGAEQGGEGPWMMDQNPGFARQAPAIASGYDTDTWLLIGGCFALLLGGTLFIFLFKRRRKLPDISVRH